MKRAEIYKDIIKRTALSERVANEQRRVKSKLEQAIRATFWEEGLEVRYIGSCETETGVTWKRDIDGVILLGDYSKESFREKSQNIDGLEGITFFDDCRIVMDKINGSFDGYQTSIGIIVKGRNPSEDIGTDLSMHAEFSKKRLTKKQKEDVILAKIFLKNLGLYGANIGGFATEQLIIKYGTFDGLLDRLSTGRPIQIDFSGRQIRRTDDPMVIRYPYCGEDNLTKISDSQFKRIVDYARIVKEDPVKFQEDSNKTVNQLFWKRRSKEIKDGRELGGPDVYLNNLEDRILRRKLHEKERLKILDVGCSNGWSALAIKREGDQLVGVDFDKDSIFYADQLCSGLEGFQFLEVEMSRLPFWDSSFDLAYAKRSISNLSSRKSKKDSLVEINRVLKSGGLFFYSDLLPEGYERINRLRELLGLGKVKIPSHAVLVGEEELVSMTKDSGFKFERVEDFSSTYYLLSRIVYPLILKGFERSPQSNSLANALFARLPSFGNIGINKMYTFRKNG